MPINYDAPYLGLLEETKPVYDQAKEERLQKIARTNTIGEAFRVLFDATGASKGGTVAPREENKPVLRSMEELRNMRKEHGEKMDRFNLLNAQNKARDIDYHIQENRITKGQDFQREEGDKSRGFSAEQADLGRKHQSSEADKGRKHQSSENALTREAQILAAKQAADIKNQTTGQDKPYYRVLEPGNRNVGHDVTEAEFHALANAIAQKDSSLKVPQLISLALGDERDQAKLKLIVQQHWDSVREVLPRLAKSEETGGNQYNAIPPFLQFNQKAGQSTGPNNYVELPQGQATGPAGEQMPQAPGQAQPPYKPKMQISVDEGNDMITRIISDPEVKPQEKSNMIYTVVRNMYPAASEEQIQNATKQILNLL